MRSRQLLFARIRAARKARGFTLIELMVVVLMVGILAVMAVPAMLEAQRNRRVYTDAAEIMQMFRLAHARAIGDQAAVTVTVNLSGGLGTILVYEATFNASAGSADPTALQQSALDSCKLPMDWTATGTANTPHGVMIDGFNFSGSIETDSSMQVSLSSAVTGAQSFCFTPSGRMYISTAIPPTFSGAPSITPLDITVKRVRGGLTLGATRDILVMPSGAVRMSSK